jgi:hypothetical protein
MPYPSTVTTPTTRPDRGVHAATMNDEILERLERIEAAQATLIEALATLVHQRQIQDWYDTATAAGILGKSPYSVREWCRLGRVHAEKRRCGRGSTKEWMISHEELMRIKSEGLLPDPMSYRHPRRR